MTEREMPMQILAAIVFAWLAWLIALGLVLAGVTAFTVASAANFLALLVVAYINVAFGKGKHWARIALLAALAFLLLLWLSIAALGITLAPGYGRFARVPLALGALAVLLSFTGAGTAWFTSRRYGTVA